MKAQKLDTATWSDYLTVCEQKERLQEQLHGIKHILKLCGHKEEVETVKLLKEMLGVR